jgi:AP-3 complex subunit mu
LPKRETEADINRIQAPTTAPLAAPIPWRKQGIRHSSNEIYFDMAESIDAIVDK